MKSPTYGGCVQINESNESNRIPDNFLHIETIFQFLLESSERISN